MGKHGLPEDGYVYANFSSASRLDRETFALWMRILDAVPGSVLWLLAAVPFVAANLMREAVRRGVDPARLVFGKRELKRSAHLARLQCADLALDTLAWHNGHSTSADMLWAGVPVLTAPGGTFPTRVASSLVTLATLLCINDCQTRLLNHSARRSAVELSIGSGITSTLGRT